MIFDNAYIFFFCALGVFNSFLVSIYFLFFQKQPQLKNTLFGVLMFLLSIRVGKTVYMSFEESKSLLVAQIGLSACFMIGVTLYYYVKASLIKRDVIPGSWLAHFGVLLLFITVMGLLKPLPSNRPFWDNFFVWMIYLTWGVYIMLSAYELRVQLYVLFTNLKKSSTPHTWLILVCLGNFLIFAAYIVGYFWLFLVEMLTFSVVFYALTFFFLSRKDRNSIFQKTPEKYARKKIAASEAQNLKERLTRLMQEEQPYKNPNLKLEELSSKLNISQHKLSQLLNDNFGESFNNYINRYRIEYAIQLLRNNNTYTLEAIGYESGFNSKSGFYSTFKKITGSTPASFRKSLD
ncbi:MAG: helix-turn-helix domain-containing protein [Bacteroidota bacterium]